VTMNVDGSEQQESSRPDEDALEQMDKEVEGAEEEGEEGEKEMLSTGLSR
jgi:hypothetical protein